MDIHKLIYDGANLLMTLENSFDGTIRKNKKGMQISRKANSQQHGIGTYSIQRVVQKYHGYYHVEVMEKNIIWRLSCIHKMRKKNKNVHL